MTASAYTVGPGRPPLHSRFQKGQSGNPGGRPGPAKQLKQRFHLALREALEKKSQALEAARPADMLAAIARQLALDAVAGRSAAQRLLLSLIEADASEKQDWVDRLIEAEQSVAPSFEEALKAEARNGERTALFSLSEGESEGENQQRIAEILKMLDEKAAVPKEQGEIREIADGAATAEGPKGEGIAHFSLSEGESEGENLQRIAEILKILDEKAAAAKEQGEIREIADGPPAAKTPEPERHGISAAA
jgi:hypothetical protein